MAPLFYSLFGGNIAQYVKIIIEFTLRSVLILQYNYIAFYVDFVV